MDADHKCRAAIIGCGYVGLALGEALSHHGCDVVGTTTTTARLAEIEGAGISARILDVADVAEIAAVVHDRHVVYLTLAAGRAGRPYRDVYLRAAENLVCALPVSTVTRVIYTSSTSVYAQQGGEWVDESSPTEPHTENGRVLVETERVLLDAAALALRGSPIGVSIVRLAGIYGPGREPHRFAARFAGQQRDDGDVFLNWVHRDDIVAALAQLREIEHHGVLNLSDDAPTTRRAVFDPLLRTANLPPVRWVDGGGADRGKRVANSRIKELLGLRLQHPRYVAEAPS